jgi:hypothetical protein
MKLTELEPRWINWNVFVFLCPHCREILLSCKNISLSRFEQRVMFERELGDDWDKKVVPMDPDFKWQIHGPGPIVNGYQVGVDFDRLTVTPSIDASASGHWHGFITRGEIVSRTLNCWNV